MVISGIVVHLTSASSDQVECLAAADPRFEVLERRNRQLALLLETVDASSSRKAIRELEALSEVVAVVPVFFGYDDDNTDKPAGEGSALTTEGKSSADRARSQVIFA